jgi:hypothetical protein
MLGLKFLARKSDGQCPHQKYSMADNLERNIAVPKKLIAQRIRSRMICHIVVL